MLGEDENNYYIASEEIQIRILSKDAKIWTPEPGSFFIASLKSGMISSGTRREISDASQDHNMPSNSKDYFDATSISFSQINQKIQEAFSNRLTDVGFKNVAGHRYIGIGITTGKNPFRISLEGYPGNCLANLNDGATFEIFGNVADEYLRTLCMRDVWLSTAARGMLRRRALQGGDVFIRGSVGNRAAIQMREYLDSRPHLIVGETADDYLAEYMAGGVVVILNLANEQTPVGSYVGTGMVGGSNLHPRENR